MNTGMISTWATDPTTIGPMYPFVGSEFYLTVALAVSYLVWQVWQIKHENQKDLEMVRILRKGAMADAKQKSA